MLPQVQTHHLDSSPPPPAPPSHTNASWRCCFDPTTTSFPLTHKCCLGTGFFKRGYACVEWDAVVTLIPFWIVIVVVYQFPHVFSLSSNIFSRVLTHLVCFLMKN